MSIQKRKRKTKKKAGLKTDERFGKILGLLCLFVSVYLCIAFISYFFTWKADQDVVLKFSWELFLQNELTVQNWLGRLGAFASNAFFYYGFGLPSLLLVFLLVRTGLNLIRKQSLKQLSNVFIHTILGMAFCSIFLEFFMHSSSFSWGGQFGYMVYIWMSNFVGTLGLLLFLIMIVVGAFIWLINPNLNFETKEFAFSLPEFGSFVSFKSDAEDPFSSNTKSKKTKKTKKGEEDTNEEDDFYLKPNSVNDSEGAVPKTESEGSGSGDSQELEVKLPDIFKDRKHESFTAPENAPLEIQDPSFRKEAERIPLEDGNVEKEEKILPFQEEQDMSQPFDPQKELSNYKYPDLDLLNSYEASNVEIDRDELEANKNQIIETLLNYKIKIVKIRATIGPTVTLYEIVPAPGIKISSIKKLEDDIALSLAALGIRIIAPIPGKGTIGIEVPNKKPQIVSLKEVLNSDKFQNTKMDLPIALGKTISNEVFVADLAKMPHLLIAGATGQGKSVGINTIIMSLLYKKHPSQVKLVMIDPKKVELFPYGNLENHFLGFLPEEDDKIITDTSKAIYTLNSLCVEMDTRYDLLQNARARNIKEYNKKFVERKLNPNKGHKYMPFIVLVIDEFADLIMTAGKEIEIPIARLAQLARAVGIHLIIATQRPSVKIITGMIKANFPARLAFKVTSLVDSRTILDSKGAEQLIGKGDMLLNVGSDIIRLQCAFVDTPEVESVIDHISEQQGFAQPFYLPEVKGEEDLSGNGSNLKYSDLDPMFEEAAKMVVGTQTGSTSNIQRRMQLGYNRAGRIMDQMEALGIVGPARGSKPREVLFMSEMELINFLDHIKNK